MQKKNNMKAILEFNLSDDSWDRIEFDNAVNGGKWKSAMWDLDQWLRKNTKYAPDSMPEEEYKAYERTRDELHRILNQSNLNLDE